MKLDKSTRAFLAQQWLREHGPATAAEIIAAGFLNMTHLTLSRMMAYGSLTREVRDRRFYYVPTDIDYVRKKGFQGSKKDE